MRRVVSFMIVAAVALCDTASLQAQTTKQDKKAIKKTEKELKEEERFLQDAAISAEAFHNAVQSIKALSFVVEANSIQPMTGPLFYVNPNTNFVSLNNGQAIIQIASNFNPNPGPNGLGGITVQGTASNIQIKQDEKENLYLSMNVMGTFISATVFLTLPFGSGKATVTVDPNFSGRNLTLSGTVVPYNQSDIFKGSTY